MKKNNNFIERSLANALAFVKDSLFAEEYALKKGFLQALDARVKIAGVVIFLCVALFSKDITSLIVLYLACLLIAALSMVDLLFFIRRTWIFIPLFTLFIALPALFEVFSPGEPVFTFEVFGLKLVITRQGLMAASVFFMRVLDSASFTILLSLTTRHTQLLKALRFLGVPRLFVMTLGMSYRYIYLFIEILQNTFMALKSRVGRPVSVKKGQGVVAWNIAGLWQRSYQLQKDVYSAMTSRGYNGEPHTYDI